MEQSGEYNIVASQEKVWQALNDPEILGASITGCQKIERTSDTTFNAKVKAKIGPVSAMFDADLELQDIAAPNSYTIVGGVKGGAAGFAKGQASVQLSENEAGTQLTYQVKASVGGKLAQIGSRLVDGAARKMADDFFSAFSQIVSDEAGADGESNKMEKNDTMEDSTKESTKEPIAEPAQETQDAEAPRYEASGSNLIWIIAFVVLAGSIILAI